MNRFVESNKTAFLKMALLVVCTIFSIRVLWAGEPQTSTPKLARAAFERFKQLEGEWIGRSTKGWEETVNYRTIANGSVVVGTSFDAHPDETMMTMYHLDGDRLMLTHYCVARNQPRLLATEFSADGRTITFTFLDGTNLPTRDKGHMDKLVLRFVDEDHVTSQWTWYQDGQEKWLEEVHLERKRQKSRRKTQGG